MNQDPAGDLRRAASSGVFPIVVPIRRDPPASRWSLVLVAVGLVICCALRLLS